jgi:hypothetical protein
VEVEPSHPPPAADVWGDLLRRVKIIEMINAKLWSSDDDEGTKSAKKTVGAEQETYFSCSVPKKRPCSKMVAKCA